MDLRHYIHEELGIFRNINLPERLPYLFQLPGMSLPCSTELSTLHLYYPSHTILSPTIEVSSYSIANNTNLHFADEIIIQNYDA